MVSSKWGCLVDRGLTLLIIQPHLFDTISKILMRFRPCLINITDFPVEFNDLESTAVTGV